MIDLHVHSNVSLDGSENVNTLLEKCEKYGIDLISITDHDSADAYTNITYPFKGQIITGLEADALINGHTFDILCYNFNLIPVLEWAKEKYQTIEFRQKKIFKELERICNNIGLIFDDTNPFDPKKEYAHQAMYRMMEDIPESMNYLKNNNIESFGDFYRISSSNKNSPLYLDMSIVWPDIKEVNDIIHKNNGKTFIAHPFKYKIEGEKVCELVYKYVDGIEISNDNTDEEIKYLYEFAKKHNLLISAGSDYHGMPTQLPGARINEEMEAEIKKWIK